MRNEKQRVDTLKLHEILELVPRMPQWEVFVEDVRANGVREAVTVQDGVILHGRNRWEAAKECGHEFIATHEVELDEETKLIVVAQSLSGYLKEDQRAGLAAIVGDSLSRKRRSERARKAGTASGRSRSKAEPDSSSRSYRDKLNTALDMARLFNLSRQKVEKAFALFKQSPELVRSIVVGRVTLRNAIREAYRRENRTNGSRAATAGERYWLFHGDCRDILRIPDESVDLIVTDLPYGKGIIELCNGLGGLAARVLKPGASLLAMVGQLYTRSILEALDQWLEMNWIISYQTPGGQSSSMLAHQVNSFWKAALWYSNGPLKLQTEIGTKRIVSDVCKSDRIEKDLHPHQQSESGMLDLVGRFVRPGDLVLDPLCGSSTTGVAALKLGARYIGIDIDEEAIRISAARLAALNHEDTRSNTKSTKKGSSLKAPRKGPKTK